MSGNTGQLALGIVGAAAGFFVAGPQGAYWGFIAGSTIGTVVFPTQLPGIQQEGPRLDDLRVQGSTYGTGLPILFGAIRVAGQMIWSQPIRQHVHVHTEEVGGKGAPSQEVTTTTYTYTVSLAVSVCDTDVMGPIIGIRKIWANKELIYNLGDDVDFSTATGSQRFAGNIRVYLGTEEQEPDPLILATEGAAPAYRGTAYVVFDELPLGDFYNRIPQFEFEVIASGTLNVPSFVALDVSGGDSVLPATAATGSVTPSGLIIAALRQSSGANRLVLLDPYSMRILREWPVNETFPELNTNNRAPNMFVPPVMNQAGDVCFASVSRLWVWPEGGRPVSFTDGIGAHLIDVDERGAFYASVASGGSQNLRRIDAGGASVLVLYATSPGTPVKGLFCSRDGFVWAAVGSGDVETEILKIPTGSATVAARLALEYEASTIAVAGDGSVWWYHTSGTHSGELWRASSDLSSRALIYDSPTATGQSEVQQRIARDWATGDILTTIGPGGGDIFRWRADGTLLREYPGQSTYSHIRTCADYPELILAFNNWSDSPGGFIGAEYSATLAAVEQPVSEIITALCGRVGIAADELDLTGMASTVRGFAIANRAPVRGALDPLMTVCKLDGVESDGKLKFFTRGLSPMVNIPEADMGAHADGAEVVDPVRVTRLQEPELPHEIALNYLDGERDYLPGVQYARRLVVASDNDTALSLAVVLSASEANELATAMLYEAWAARMRYSVPVSTKYAKYEPGDVVTLALAEGDVPVRLVGKQESAGVVQLEAFGYDQSIYTQSNANAPSGPLPSGAVNVAGPTNLVLLDTALLREQDDAPGLYAIAGGFLQGWPGARLFKSSDDGATYVDTGLAFAAGATIGYSVTRLADFRGGNVFDEINSVDVSLMSGAVSSATAAAVLSGANAAFLGGEIFTFKNAVLVSDGVYRLSGLLRGRLGTEWAMRAHAIGEQFVLLTHATTVTVPAPSSDIGVARQYRAVTLGRQLATTPVKTHTLAANRLRPLAPVHIGGGRNAAGDVLLDWVRRARMAAAWADNIDVPLDETTQAYEVDVFAGAGVSITDITAAYPAEITAAGHGLTAGAALHLSEIAGGLGDVLNGHVYTVDSIVSTSRFTIAVNTGALPVYSSGGKVRARARTLTSTTASATYTSAQQVSDYGANQSSVHVAVYQMSARVGRGYPGEGAV